MPRAIRGSGPRARVFLFLPLEFDLHLSAARDLWKVIAVRVRGAPDEDVLAGERGDPFPEVSGSRYPRDSAGQNFEIGSTLCHAPMPPGVSIGLG